MHPPTQLRANLQHFGERVSHVLIQQTIYIVLVNIIQFPHYHLCATTPTTSVDFSHSMGGKGESTMNALIFEQWSNSCVCECMTKSEDVSQVRLVLTSKASWSWQSVLYVFVILFFWPFSLNTQIQYKQPWEWWRRFIKTTYYYPPLRWSIWLTLNHPYPKVSQKDINPSMSISIFIFLTNDFD